MKESWILRDGKHTEIIQSPTASNTANCKFTTLHLFMGEVPFKTNFLSAKELKNGRDSTRHMGHFKSFSLVFKSSSRTQMVHFQAPSFQDLNSLSEVPQRLPYLFRPEHYLGLIFQVALTCLNLNAPDFYFIKTARYYQIARRAPKAGKQ